MLNHVLDSLKGNVEFKIGGGVCHVPSKELLENIKLSVGKDGETVSEVGIRTPRLSIYSCGHSESHPDDDLAKLTAMYADIGTMKNHPSGVIRSAEWVSGQYEDQCSRWKSGNICSGFICRGLKGEFVGHAVISEGRNGAPGIMECMVTIAKEQEGKDLKTEIVFAMMHVFMPWCQSEGYTISGGSITRFCCIEKKGFSEDVYRKMGFTGSDAPPEAKAVILIPAINGSHC